MEGLYIDGKLVEEGSPLGEGNFREFWLDVAVTYRMKPSDLTVKELSGRDTNNADSSGRLPNNIVNFVDSALYI